MTTETKWKSLALALAARIDPHSAERILLEITANIFAPHSDEGTDAVMRYVDNHFGKPMVVLDKTTTKSLCDSALAAVAGSGMATPEETYGVNVDWALRDCIRALSTAKDTGLAAEQLAEELHAIITEHLGQFHPYSGANGIRFRVTEAARRCHGYELMLEAIKSAFDNHATPEWNAAHSKMDLASKVMALLRAPDKETPVHELLDSADVDRCPSDGAAPFSLRDRVKHALNANSAAAQERDEAHRVLNETGCQTRPSMRLPDRIREALNKMTDACLKAAADGRSSDHHDWRVPKPGDKVRCVKPVPNDGTIPKEVLNNFTVGTVYDLDRVMLSVRHWFVPADCFDLL